MFPYLSRRHARASFWRYQPLLNKKNSLWELFEYFKPFFMQKLIQMRQDFWVSFVKIKICIFSPKILKLDGVGPVDNRPSTDKLHHFVKKKMTCDMGHVTCDTWHMTCDTWHMTRDIWHVTHDTWHVTCLGGEYFLKISAP